MSRVGGVTVKLSRTLAKVGLCLLGKDRGQVLRGAWLPVGLEEDLCQSHPLNIQLGSTSVFAEQMPIKQVCFYLLYLVNLSDIKRSWWERLGGTIFGKGWVRQLEAPRAEN